MQNPKVKNIKTELLSNNWYTLNKITFDYLMPDNTWVNQARESYDRGNGAAVLLYNKDKKKVILIEQFRMPTYVNGNKTGMMIEACAGLLDGDAPEVCVIKEAEEESGYRVKNIQKVMESYMSPGAVTEIVHLFVAEYDQEMKVSSGGGLASEQEDILVHELDFKAVIEMVKSGKIKDAKTIMLIQYLQLEGLLN